MMFLHVAQCVVVAQERECKLEHDFCEVDVVRVVLRGWSVGMCACVCGGCVLSVLSVLSVSVPI
jgi:hypothetical protein